MLIPRGFKNKVGEFMKVLIRITDKITKVLTFCSCVYLIIIVIACFLQVFSRYILNSSFGWTEETARYAYAGLGMLGTPVALRKGLHVTINILETKLHGKAKKIQRVLIDISVFLISMVIFIYGIIFIAKINGLYSSVLRVPMFAVYYVIPFCGASSMWVTFVDFIEAIKLDLDKEGSEC